MNGSGYISLFDRTKDKKEYVSAVEGERLPQVPALVFYQMIKLKEDYQTMILCQILN